MQILFSHKAYPELPDAKLHFLPCNQVAGYSLTLPSKPITMKLKNALLEWITFTLIFFFLYDVIWAVIDFDTFKRFLTETYIKGTLLDLLYCGLFSFVSLLITSGLLKTRLFREAENDRKKFLAGGVIILTANALLAGICEFLINVAFPRYALKDVWGSFYIFAIIGSLLTLIYLLRHYADVVIQRNRENFDLQKKYLKLQLNPHFVFNSLSSLAGMIGTDQEMAEEYVVKLSHIYRKMLNHIEKDYITISEALEFSRIYVDMLNMRYENNIELEIEDCNGAGNECILSMSLQLLIENAVKHNAPVGDEKLCIRISRTKDYLSIWNNRLYARGRNDQKIESYGIGLSNLERRYVMECGEKPKISETESSFEVELPILRNQTV